MPTGPLQHFPLQHQHSNSSGGFPPAVPSQSPARPTGRNADSGIYNPVAPPHGFANGHNNHNTTSPAYSPTSPAYSPTSPAYHPNLNDYSPTSPRYTPPSPFGPRDYSAGEGVPVGNDFGLSLASPAYSPTSPMYSPTSPGYTGDGLYSSYEPHNDGLCGPPPSPPQYSPPVVEYPDRRRDPSYSPRSMQVMAYLLLLSCPFQDDCCLPYCVDSLLILQACHIQVYTVWLSSYLTSSVTHRLSLHNTKCLELASSVPTEKTRLGQVWACAGCFHKLPCWRRVFIIS